jgi:hypothetical protein
MRNSGLGGDMVNKDRRSSYDLYETGLPNDGFKLEREPQSGRLGME